MHLHLNIGDIDTVHSLFSVVLIEGEWRALTLTTLSDFVVFAVNTVHHCKAMVLHLPTQQMAV